MKERERGLCCTVWTYCHFSYCHNVPLQQSALFKSTYSCRICLNIIISHVYCLSLSLSPVAKTIQTAAPAPCTFISTSRHYKAGGNVRTDKYQRCRKKHNYCSWTKLKRDPMYKTFDVVSSFQSFHIAICTLFLIQ